MVPDAPMPGVTNVIPFILLSAGVLFLLQDDEGQPEACAKVMRELCERALDRHEEDEDPAQGIEEEWPDIDLQSCCCCWWWWWWWVSTKPS